MTDDIVNILRKEYEYFNAGRGGDYETILSAIEEIEYLRNEIAEHNSEYQKLWNKYNALMRDRKYPLTNDYTGEDF